MNPPSSPAPATSRVCVVCSAPVPGRFCSQCGAPADGGACGSCQAPLSPGARFCHRCGAPAGGGSNTQSGRERLPWVFAGLAGVALLLAVLWRVNLRPTVPDMANAGNVDNAGTGGAVPALSTRGPDISSMTPRERFDRLWNRVIQAAESGDSTTVLQFAPMALGAYSQLDTVNTDARYHAGTIALVIGDYAAVEALADTILAQAPGHLLAYVLRGEVAERQNRTEALTQSYRDFLAHEAAELRAGRPEYAEHQPILDDFRTRAKASIRP